MLILWLIAALRALAKLLIPPPAELLTRRDANERCPACGNCKGSLEFERVSGGRPIRVADPNVQMEVDRKLLAEAKPAIKHTCGVCRFMWYEPVVGKPEWPAA